MKFGSVCSGIEAASCAWLSLGWRCAFVSEIEAFPCTVLKHHYPETPNWGDMTKFKEWPDAAIDALVGGTPCQSFSVAGLRKGMDDPRGNLMLTYLAIAAKYRPAWLVWENVPGVLSSNGGRDFASFLRRLAELGYGFAYRILDAQYLGVPQRRRRVFVVGCFGDWRRAAAVLFERHSLQGHTPPRREAGQRPAPTISARTKGGGGLGTDFDSDGGLLAFGGNDTRGPIDVATARNACASASGRLDFESETFIAHSLRADGFDASEDGTGRVTPLVPIHFGGGSFPGGAPTLTGRRGDQSGVMTLAIRGRGDSLNLEYRDDGTSNTILTPNGGRAGIGVGAVAFDTTQITSKGNYSNPAPGLCHPLAAGAHPPAIAGMQVRRLTPEECEFLQGFPRGYTAIPYRGKPAAAGPRYKALGNSMAVPVMRWIGERIQAVHELARAA